MRELTGRHVLAITVGAFSVIIAVNVVLAWQAVKTFPGQEVQSSYIASQTFDQNRKAQQALGWQLTTRYSPENGLRLQFQDRSGRPVQVDNLKVRLAHGSQSITDKTADFRPVTGAYQASLTLNPGKWMIYVEANAADGTLFQQRLDFQVKG